MSPSTCGCALPPDDGITAAIPHGFSAIAKAKWRWIDHRAASTAHLVRNLLEGVLALVF